MVVAVAGPCAAGIFFGYLRVEYTLPLLLSIALTFVIVASVSAAVAITATKTYTFIGGDGDGKADPGETIEYTVVTTNSGSTDATEAGRGGGAKRQRIGQGASLRILIGVLQSPAAREGRSPFCLRRAQQRGNDWLHGRSHLAMTRDLSRRQHRREGQRKAEAPVESEVSDFLASHICVGIPRRRGL